MKRPNGWILLTRCIGAYYLAVAAWWGIGYVNRELIPARQYVPPVDVDTWVYRPAWTVAGVIILGVIFEIARHASTPGLHKYGTQKWNTALEQAGLIKNPVGSDAKPAPRASMVGRVRQVDETTLVALRLPPGLVVSQVAAKAEHIAAALSVPPERLHLGRHRDNPGVLTARIDPPDLPLKPRVVDPPDETSWRTPVLIGRDLRGRDVTAPTYDIGQWLVGGITGSGKTTLLRLLAAHYALDPDATIWGCDGKGSRDDWGPLRHRVHRWVDVTDPDASTLYLEMLRDIAEEVTTRNRAGGRDHPGMLVILEEATALRASLDPADMKEADRHLVRIVQTCRSGNVLVVTAAQRPSATLMSTNVRAQAGVGICMNVRSMTDAEMVLGYRPEVALPDAVGRALLDVGDGKTRAVLVDHMPDQQWRDLCHQWRPVAAVPDIVDDELDEEPQDEPVMDPLVSAVAHVLMAAQTPMTAGELWPRLPVEVRCEDAMRLGQALSALGVASRKRRVAGVQGRFYDVADLSLDAVPDVSQAGTGGQAPQDATGV